MIPLCFWLLDSRSVRSRRTTARTRRPSRGLSCTLSGGAGDAERSVSPLAKKGPAMERYIKFVTSLALVFLVLSLSLNGEAQRRKKTTRKASPKNEVRLMTVDDEAQAFANQAVDFVFRKCGDSWYHYNYYTYPYNSHDLHEWKGLQAAAYADELDVADKLNGIQWSGRVYIGPTVAHRGYRFSDSKWWEWRNSRTTGAAEVRFDLKKVNGNWTFRKFGDNYYNKFLPELDEVLPANAKPKCEDIAHIITL